MSEHEIRKEVIRRAVALAESRRREQTVEAFDQATADVVRQFTDTPPEEVERIIRDVRAAYSGELARHRGRRRRLAMAVGVAVALVIAGILVARLSLLGPADRSSPPAIEPSPPPVNPAPSAPPGLSATPGPSASPGPSRPAVPAAAPAARSDSDAAPASGEMPAYGDAYHRKALETALPLVVSISRDRFKPADMMAAASWSQSTPLEKEPPEGIRRHPEYEGVAQRYGALRLGTLRDNRHFFAFDLVRGPNPALYFDRNGNGDLTDDGPAITNEGTGIFAARIAVPFERIIPEALIAGPCEIWFFSNDSLWEQGRVAHYLRTQLSGEIKIAGQLYGACIADMGLNDADFTNDGIHIDLDGNGRFDNRTEYFPPDRVARIGGRDYKIVVGW